MWDSHNKILIVSDDIKYTVSGSVGAMSSKSQAIFHGSSPAAAHYTFFIGC